MGQNMGFGQSATQQSAYQEMLRRLQEMWHTWTTVDSNNELKTNNQPTWGRLPMATESIPGIGRDARGFGWGRSPMTSDTLGYTADVRGPRNMYSTLTQG